jgi:hypothetical protein
MLAVEVYGTAFDELGAITNLTRCRFNRTVVPAAMIDAGTLLCLTLETLPGLATLEVTMNGVDWTADGRAFEFVAQHVTSVYPLQGPSAGGTRIAQHSIL